MTLSKTTVQNIYILCGGASYAHQGCIYLNKNTVKTFFVNFLHITIYNIFHLSLHDPLEIFLIFGIQEAFILINAENSFCCLIFNNLVFGNCHTFISVFLMN